MNSQLELWRAGTAVLSLPGIMLAQPSAALSRFSPALPVGIQMYNSSYPYSRESHLLTLSFLSTLVLLPFKELFSPPTFKIESTHVSGCLSQLFPPMVLLQLPSCLPIHSVPQPSASPERPSLLYSPAALLKMAPTFRTHYPSLVFS